MRKFLKTNLKKLKTVSSVIVCMLGVVCFTSITYAQYDGNKAVTYAGNHYEDNDSGEYYYFSGNNCTNFVSQCIAHGGITTKENKFMTEQSIIPTLPYIYDDDTTYRYWYMVKKKSALGFRNYYLTTANWTSVKELRLYHGYHEGTVYSYANNSAGRNKLMKEVKRGDILQAGTKHSIIVSEVGNRTLSTILYYGQSTSRHNEPLSTFVNFANNNSCNVIYRISFK